MSKRYMGVVVPKQDLVAVFYKKGKLIREEIISLVVSEWFDKDKDRATSIAEPLLLRDSGLVNAVDMANYLGIEKKNKPLDWSKGIKKLEEQKKFDQEVKRVSKLCPKEQIKYLKKVGKKEKES